MANPNLPNNPGYNLYVGARYVPVFSDVNNGIWDTNTAYEPLTIVSYLGDSYTSKTFVPVGVNPSNTTYWAKTGNYNVQIETINQEIDTLNTSISSLDGEVAQIDQELENLSNSTTQSITNLTSDLRQKTTSAPHNKRIFCMGDSTNMASGWGSYIHQILGCETTVLGNVGAGFHHLGTTEPYEQMNFLNTLKEYVKTVSTSDLELYDTFVLVGGYNDAYYDNSPLTTILPDITPFFSYVSQTFRNAEIIYMPNGSNENNSLKTFGRLLKIVNSIPPYVRNVKNMMCVGIGNQNWFSDTIHQNNYERYANYIAQAIVSQNFRYTNTKPLTGGFLPVSSTSRATIEDFEVSISSYGSSQNISFKAGGGSGHEAFIQPFNFNFNTYRNNYPLNIIASIAGNTPFSLYSAAVSVNGSYSGLSENITPTSPEDCYSFHITQNLFEFWSTYSE